MKTKKLSYYWPGKELSRQYSPQTEEDIKTFFSNCQLGRLRREKEKSSHTILSLQEPAVESRFETFNPNFPMETGVLVGFYQTIHHVYTEASANVQADQKK